MYPTRRQRHPGTDSGVSTARARVKDRRVQADTMYSASLHLRAVVEQHQQRVRVQFREDEGYRSVEVVIRKSEQEDEVDYRGSRYGLSFISVCLARDGAGWGHVPVRIPVSMMSCTKRTMMVCVAANWLPLRMSCSRVTQASAINPTHKVVYAQATPLRP